MGNGADSLLMEQLDEAIEDTRDSLPLATERTCPGHPALHSTVDGTRKGVHVLCLCRKADLTNPKSTMHASKSFKLGRFEVKGYDSSDLTKILLALIIIMLLAGDKLPKLWQGHASRGAIDPAQVSLVGHKDEAKP